MGQVLLTIAVMGFGVAYITLAFVGTDYLIARARHRKQPVAFDWFEGTRLGVGRMPLALVNASILVAGLTWGALILGGSVALLGLLVGLIYR